MASVSMLNGAHGQETALKDLDADSDGKVSVDEFQSYAGGKLQNFEKLVEFAKAVDSDSNGEISQAEFDGRMDVLQKMAQAMNESAEKKSEDGANKTKETDEKKASGEKADSDAQKEAKEAFTKIQKLIAKKKWKDAAKLMTKKAQDEVVIEQTISSIGLANIEIDLPIPNLEDSIDEIEDALVKHGLMDLDIDTSSMFRMEFSMGEEEDEEDESEKEGKAKEQAKKMEGEGKKILDHIAKSGNRWEIVGDLWDAKASSPFSMSAFSGKIQKQEEDGQVQLLYVSMAPAATDNQDGGVMIQMMAPPAVMRMTKTDGKWLLDGRDEKRTASAMKEFMEKQQDMFGGGAEMREDF
jgi:hypothetical protein